jgi:hypothetical protein
LYARSGRSLGLTVYLHNGLKYASAGRLENAEFNRLKGAGLCQMIKKMTTRWKQERSGLTSAFPVRGQVQLVRG